MKAALQAYLDDAIPLVRHMGVRVRVAEDACVVLTAPLGPNLNHVGSAFGGSIAALATLACWSWLWSRTEHDAAHPRIVVARSGIDYLAPVTTDLVARCDAPATAALQAFEATFERRGRARIALEAIVEDSSGQPCARFKGDFAVSRQHP